MSIHSKIALSVGVALVGCTLPVTQDEPVEGAWKNLVFIYSSNDVASTTGTIKFDNAGTGFLVSEDGLIVTADHLITDDLGNVRAFISAIRPTPPPLEPFELEVIARLGDGTKGRDIAILKAKLPKDLSSHFTVATEASRELRVGDPVLMIGFPQVFDRLIYKPLVRYGIVSSTQYPIEGDDQTFILDMTSVKGFSGAPVLNRRTNKVVGVLTSHPIVNDTGFSVATRITSTDIGNALDKR